jgi:hypothetical protein
MANIARGKVQFTASMRPEVRAALEELAAASHRKLTQEIEVALDWYLDAKRSEEKRAA